MYDEYDKQFKIKNKNDKNYKKNRQIWWVWSALGGWQRGHLAIRRQWIHHPTCHRAGQNISCIPYISRGGFLSISYLHHLTCHEPDQNISYLIDVTFCLVDSRTNLLVGNLHIFMEYFVWGKIVASEQKKLHAGEIYLPCAVCMLLVLTLWYICTHFLLLETPCSFVRPSRFLPHLTQTHTNLIWECAR